MDLPPRWLLGLALASLVAFIAARARALDASGAVAAAALGAVAVGAGWSWGVLLIAYFVVTSLLSRYRAAERDARTEGRVAKGGRRDAVQVAANGGVFGLAALAWWYAPAPVIQWLGAGALAASAADTFATEIGTLARGAARSIRDWSPVAAGTSGGVTVAGSVAALVGAAVVGGVTLAVGWPAEAAAAALAGGLAGTTADSLIGAAAQERRWCASCAMATEQRVHRCGAATTHRGGLRGLDNDATNALATLVGAVVGALIASSVAPGAGGMR